MSSGKPNNTRSATKASKQSYMLRGVSLPSDDHGVADYDELLREALRIAMRIEPSATGDDFSGPYVRIQNLMLGFIESPAGRGYEAADAMTRLAVSIIDVISPEERERMQLVGRAGAGSPSQAGAA